MKRTKRTALTRSQVMARVKGIDTKPELIIRRLLTRLGYRYRLHRADIPGKPDIAFVTRRKAIFIHGCFWHGHDCPRGAREPKTNVDYWRAKIARNQARDTQVRESLLQAGWDVMTIWECELRDLKAIEARLSIWLGAQRLVPKRKPK